MEYDTRTVREGGSFAMEGRSNKLQRKERLFCTLKMVCGILYSRVLKNTRYEDDYTYYRKM